MISKQTQELLLPPQIPHVETLVNSLMLNGFANDLSEMGTGKTYAAGAILKECNLPFIVICPKAVLVSWQRVLSTFNIKPIAIINYEKIIRGNTKYYKYVKTPTCKFITKGDKQIELKNDVGTFKKLPSNVIIVLDEVHKCKAMDSSTSELLLAATNQGFKRLKISGSAATSPLEMYAFGFSNGLHPHKDVNTFKRNFCTIYGAEWTGKFGQMTFDPESDKGRQGMLSIHNELFNTRKVASRMTKKGMGVYFPETKIMPVSLDMGVNSNKIDRVYNLMQRELDLLDERTENYSAHVFAIIMKARRHAELLKVPTFVEEIETGVAENHSVAAFFNFTESLEAVQSRLEKNKFLKGRISTVVGGQNVNQRQSSIDDFQADKNIVILCNIKAGGTGISLHDLNGNRPRLALVSPGFSAIELIQALSRVDRQGGKTKSLQRIIFAAKTIEEQACERLQYRIDNLTALNDGELLSGVRFAGNSYSYNFQS